MNRKNSHRQRSVRRGSAAVALVVTLGLLSLVVVGVVMAGARDTNVGTDRMDGLRAQMAAEAGLQMGIREVSTNADEDADGGTGTIGSAAPMVVGDASVQVAKSTSASITTLTSTGTRGNAIRKVQCTLQSVAGATNPVLFWSTATNKKVTPTTFDGTSWTSETSSSSSGGNLNWIRAAACPLRDEVLVASLDSTSEVDLSIRTNGTWGSLNALCTDVSTSSSRAFDVAYEQASGRGLVVYWDNAAARFGCRTVTNGVISAEINFVGNSNNDFRYISLVPRPNSDEILMLAVDLARVFYVSTWDGSSFGSFTKLCDAVTNVATTQCVAGTFETLSGRAMVVWGDAKLSTPRYAIKTGTSWSSAASMGSVSNTINWVRLASDPLSDNILLGICTSAPKPYLSNWNGSSWATPTNVSSALMADDGHLVDVAFEATTGKGLALYRKIVGSNEATLYLRPWTGSAWGSESATFSVSQNPDWFFLVPKPGTSEIYVAVKSTSGLIDVAKWNGSTMSAKTSITTSGTSTDAYCPMSLVVGSSSGGGVTISSITQIP